MKLFFQDALLWGVTFLTASLKVSKIRLTIFFFNLVSFGDWKKISPQAQQKLATLVGLLQKKYRLGGRLTDPTAIEIIFDIALNQISNSQPKSMFYSPGYFNTISDFLIHPATSSELLNRMLAPELGPSWIIVRVLGEKRFQNVTVPMIKRTTDNGKSIERVLEFVKHKYIYLASLPVVFYLYTVTPSWDKPMAPFSGMSILEEALCVKLKTRTWSEAVNLILTCNGFEREKLNDMPLMWRESLLKNIEDPSFEFSKQLALSN